MLRIKHRIEHGKIYIKTVRKHPLLNHFEFWTFIAIQCHIRFCFKTCLNKRVVEELVLCILHSFDIICNADEAKKKLCLFTVTSSQKIG